MFVFIIPRTPKKNINKIRDSLWKLCVKSLLLQQSSNWKAIVIGEPDNSLDDNRFIFLNYDEIDKHSKINYAIDYIEKNLKFKTEYIIRLDDDDLIAPTTLKKIEELNIKYDCYYDEFHAYLDIAYLKISRKKNIWMANTVIHSIENALMVCGPHNKILINQDHSAYWHIHYANKKKYCFKKNESIYFRILTPFSVTSLETQSKSETNWENYLGYLKGYGPWINLPSNFIYEEEIRKISDSYLISKPKINIYYWIINRIKYFLYK